MKLLISNHWLKKLGGSETFTYTLGTTLKNLGHNVHFYTNVNGLVSEKLKAAGIPQQLDDSYDLILANHNTTVNALHDLGPIIQTCHGTTPKLEQPSPAANAYVAISDEIKFYLADKHKLDSKVILNGIDLNRFKSRAPLNYRCKTILSLCHSDEANAIIAQTCKILGINLRVINKFNTQVWDMPTELNRADLVITLGRGAYEAFACGRPVVIFDNRPYMPSFADGYVNAINIKELITTNCSGRFLKLKLNAYDLAAEIKKYNPEDGVFLRQYAEMFLNMEHNAKQYLTINLNK